VGERLVDEWFVVFECYPYGGFGYESVIFEKDGGISTWVGYCVVGLVMSVVWNSFVMSSIRGIIISGMTNV